MKKVFHMIVLSCTTLTTEAQTISNFSAYDAAIETSDVTHFYLGIGFSIPPGGVLSATFILKNGWGGSVTFNAVFPKAKNLPSNFTGGSGLFNLFGENKTYDDIYATSIRILREFPTTNKKIRLGLEAGPSFVRTKIPVNFQYDPNPCGFLGCGPNYTWEELSSHSFGVSLKGKVEFLISVPFGLEIGLTSNLNPDRSYFGADVLINLGYVRE